MKHQGTIIIVSLTKVFVSKSPSIKPWYDLIWASSFNPSCLWLGAAESTNLGVDGLEDPALSVLLEGNTELEELDNDVGEVLEEELIVGGVLLNPLLELLVLDEGHVGGKHHEGLGLLVLKLLGAVPLLPLPLLVEEELVVVVGQNGGGEGPGTIEAGAVGVAAAESVSTGKSNDLLVVEAHAVEDVAEMVLGLGGIGKTTIGSAGSDVTVLTAGAVGNLGAKHLLDGADTGKNPEIGVGDPWELGCSGRQLR